MAEGNDRLETPPRPSGTPILIRHQGLRRVSQAELLAALGGLPALGNIPVDFELDTTAVGPEIDDGDWRAALGRVWQTAQEVHATAARVEAPRLIYGSAMPEVALATALGAYVGDTHHLEAYQHHDGGSWAWPSVEETLRLAAQGIPHEPLAVSGPAILRLEITTKVADVHVHTFVEPGSEIAEIRIAPANQVSAPGLVRSLADVEEVRRAVREAIAALVEHRPGMTVLHLFISAPPSACVITGQELRLRNNAPVQTYRHRQQGGQGVMSEAVRLQYGGPSPVELPLTEEETGRAKELEDRLWKPALEKLEGYVEQKEREANRWGGAADSLRWYDGLLLGPEFARLRPFVTLPPVQAVVERPSTLGGIPSEARFFAYLPEEKRWMVNPRFSVRLSERFPEEDDAFALVRIFLFHEYLHTVHGITKATADEVGKFANGLEHADYMCDLYGIVHEIDYEAGARAELTDNVTVLKERVAELINLVILSFWAFEERETRDEMEYRRMRRYMNWYWQYVRVRRCTSKQQLAAVLARKPIVEIAGLASRAEGRRHYGSLRRYDDAVGLEIGIVLDSEQLYRIPAGPITPLREMVEGFRTGDHGAIQQTFRQLFEAAAQTGNALPKARSWE